MVSKADKSKRGRGSSGSPNYHRFSVPNESSDLNALGEKLKELRLLSVDNDFRGWFRMQYKWFGICMILIGGAMLLDVFTSHRGAIPKPIPYPEEFNGEAQAQDEKAPTAPD